MERPSAISKAIGALEAALYDAETTREQRELIQESIEKLSERTSVSDINCNVCGKEAKHTCQQCKCAAYCSEKCAERDWTSGKHCAECFSHDESALMEVEMDLEAGTSPLGHPLSAEAMEIGHLILDADDHQAAIYWLEENRMHHANPTSPIEAQSMFQERSEFIGPNTPSQWWSNRKQQYSAWKQKRKGKTKGRSNARQNARVQQFKALQTEKRNTKWYQFRKRRDIKRRGKMLAP